MKTIRPVTFALVAACLFVAAALPARAADPVSENDTARFLAGMPPAAESPLAPLTKERVWQQHARFFDTAFDQFDRRQLGRIRAWSDKTLTGPQPTLFYMFSGPDFLYADAFFPKAKTYVLSGLEPVGAVPDLTKLARPTVGAALHNMESSLSSILNFSFFITRRMKSDLHAGQVNGTLPILYVFLARSGKTVRETSFVKLDDQGAVHPDSDPGPKNATRGVKIVFAGSDGEARTLYYFSTDLGNGGVRTSGFLKFCETLAPGDSLVKSASYLLHSGGFSVVRDFMLAHTTLMLQDDSGIPLNYFDSKAWQFHPYGRYLGPLGIFPGRYQARYATLFRQSRPIDFGIGYRWRSNESNLLLATRAASPPSPPAEGTAAGSPPAGGPATTNAIPNSPAESSTQPNSPQPAARAPTARQRTARQPKREEPSRGFFDWFSSPRRGQTPGSRNP